MAIRQPLVVGMGRVGSLIALLLSELGMQVTGVDMQQGASIPAHVEFASADVTDPRILARLCHDRDALIVCLPYPLILGAAQVAHTSGMHYFDLTEDVATTHAINSDPATERLKNSRISEVIVTNTLPIPPEKRLDKITVLSIAPLLARAIREVFDDGSVTTLFGGLS